MTALKSLSSGTARGKGNTGRARRGEAARLILGGGCLLLRLLGALPGTAWPEDAQNPLQKGLHDLLQGKFPSAIRHFESAADAGEKRNSALYYLGYSYYRSGRYREALRAFQRSYEIAPGSSLPASGRGVPAALVESGKNSRERTMGPALRNPHFQKGLALLGRRDFESALQEFEAASAELPSEAGLSFYRGYALYKLKKFRRARTAFKEAYQGRPDYSPSLRRP